MTDYAFDILSPGLPLQAVAQGSTEVEQYDLRTGTMPSERSKGSLGLTVVEPKDQLELAKVTPDGDIDERGYYICLFRATVLLELPEGAPWTLKRDARQTITMPLCEPESPATPLTVQPMYAPIMGGDAAGSKNSATAALMQSFGIPPAGGVRGIANRAQQLAGRPIDLGRLMTRGASLYLGLRMRTGDSASTLPLGAVNPPDVTQVNTVPNLREFWDHAIAGAPCILVHPDRPDYDQWVITHIARLLLSQSIQWPAGSQAFCHDLLWPSLVLGSDHSSYLGVLDPSPTRWEAVCANDVLTGMESLLADLSVPIEKFDGEVDEVLFSCYHVKGEGLQ
jgi:hypothetical protein